ncbi:hypothetical protein Dimus_019189 [Dionaea muscipula]
MNAATIPRDGFTQEHNPAEDSDSDAHSDGIPDHYQPISTIGAEEDDENEDDDFSGGARSEEYGRINLPSLANGHVYPTEDTEMMITMMMRSTQLSEALIEEAERQVALIEEAERQEEEEERRRAASESAMRRAFQEDESRRNAPLTPENATRVIQAMRGISFGGSAPEWAHSLPEDRWIDQLRRLRQ